MSSKWADNEREKIKELNLQSLGQEKEPSAFQEFTIPLLVKVMDGSLEPSVGLTKQIADQLLASGQTPSDAWYDFLNCFTSAAFSTSSDSSHEHLAELLFALEKTYSLQDGAYVHRDRQEPNPDVPALFSNLMNFSLIMREYWNGQYLGSSLTQINL